jgi:hypothetical protein
LPDQTQNTWAIHDGALGAVSTTADRRTRRRILGSDRPATQQESQRSRECFFWGLGQSLPKRTQGRRDRQRMSPWMEHRTVTSRCQPEERPVRLAPPGAGDHDKPRLRPRSMYPRNHAGNASPMIAGLAIAGARWLLT